MSALYTLPRDKILSLQEISDLTAIPFAELKRMAIKNEFIVPVKRKYKVACYRLGEVADWFLGYNDDKQQHNRKASTQSAPQKSKIPEIPEIVVITSKDKPIAPKGATHKSETGIYYKISQVNGVLRVFRFCPWGQDWYRAASLEQSLSAPSKPKRANCQDGNHYQPCYTIASINDKGWY